MLSVNNSNLFNNGTYLLYRDTVFHVLWKWDSHMFSTYVYDKATTLSDKLKLSISLIPAVN
jgi:hypothetical protein